MKNRVKVGDIMTRDFVSINSDSTLKEAVKKMMKERVASIILKDNGKLKGLLTEKEILLVLGEGEIENLGEIRAKDVSKKRVATINPSKSIKEALSKMSKEKTRWLPVTKNGEVIGYLTLNDIVKVEPSLLELYHSMGKI